MAISGESNGDRALDWKLCIHISRHFDCVWHWFSTYDCVVLLSNIISCCGDGNYPAQKRTHNIAIEKEIQFSWIDEPQPFRLLYKIMTNVENKNKNEEEKQNYRSKRLWCIDKMLAKKSKCMRSVGQCYISVHKTSH